MLRLLPRRLAPRERRPLAAAPSAPAPAPANPQIDYPGFQRLAARVEPYRRTRLVGWAAFAAFAPGPAC